MLAKIFHGLIKRNFSYMTANSRVLPDFIIIGTVRSGTTSLYYNMCKHPSILSASTDEIGFFDSNYQLGIEWYKSMFPKKTEMNKIKEKTKFSITGEDTPFYFWKADVIDRIHKVIPDCKLIAILRNPIDRTYSNYQIGVKYGSENLSFEEAIREEKKFLENNTSQVDPELKYSRPRSYLAKSHYSEQIKMWHKKFPRNQLLIISTEEYTTQHQKTFDDIFRFLELPTHKIGNPEKKKVEKYVSMNSNTRQRLLDYFRPYNSDLYKLIGKEFDWNI